MSRHDACEVLARQPNKFTHLVSIIGTDDHTIPPFQVVDNRVELQFDDVLRPFGAYTPPNEHDIRRLIAWAIETKPKDEDGMRFARYLFHCAAGISRSTAAAFIVLVAIGFSEGEAMGMLTRARKIARPHQGMVAMADAQLGRNGAMVDAIVEFEARRRASYRSSVA